MNKKEKEELYLKAKDAYYKGKPILTDSQFDDLESDLEGLGSEVIEVVGGTDSDERKLIHPHLSPMLSLAKVQVNDEDNFPQAELEKWVNDQVKNGIDPFPLEATPKFDGNSVELQYMNGTLHKALTRGRNGKGADITDKLRHLVPQTIPSPNLIEIRGEVVMSNKTFEQKYLPNGFKHPRNTVAGIMSKDDVAEEKIKDCQFIAFSIKMDTAAGLVSESESMELLSKLGFNVNVSFPIVKISGPGMFRSTYDVFKKFRLESSEFVLDGIVLKMREDVRSIVGETSHHPKWALAIKFPSQEAETEITDIEWNVGYTGVLAPTGILKPVYLDGSIISRVSLHNKTRIEEMGLYPGAVVRIKRSGDIIPMITKVLSSSNNTTLKHPTECPGCGCELSFETYSKNDPTVHIVCNNEYCKAKLVKKLNNGISCLEIKGIGEATAEWLVEAGIRDIIDFFDPDRMNESFLITNGNGRFKKGRQLEIIISCSNQLKEVELHKVIHSLQFKGLGESSSKEVAKCFHGMEYSFSGLERSIVEPFMDKGSEPSITLTRFLDALTKKRIKIKYPEMQKLKNTETIRFEMTGSPKEFGFKTKEEFVKLLAENGYQHSKLKDSSILVTDSYDSTSSKMGDARKKGIEILTYDDLLKRIG